MPVTDVRPITTYSKKRPDQSDQLLPEGVVEEVPAQRAEQGNTSLAEVRQEVVFAELLTLP